MQQGLKPDDPYGPPFQLKPVYDTILMISVRWKHGKADQERMVQWLVEIIWLEWHLHSTFVAACDLDIAILYQREMMLPNMFSLLSGCLQVNMVWQTFILTLGF